MKRSDSVEAKYNRLNERVASRLPITAAESRWLWTETSRRHPIELRAYPINGGTGETSAEFAQRTVRLINGDRKVFDS